MRIAYHIIDLGDDMVYRRIRDLREDNDKTQETMADYLHVDQTTYSGYETGKISIPVEALVKLADYYDVSIDYLLNRTDMKSVNKEA